MKSAGVKPSGVLTLTDESFDAAVREHKRVLVKFYAPWCGHCKQLEPVWAEASKLLAVENLETRLAKVDATENKALEQRFVIDAFPKLKYFVDGAEVKQYEGERTAKAISHWLRKQEQPPVKEIAYESIGSFFGGIADGDFALAAVVKKKSARAKAFYKAVEDVLSEYEFATFRFAVAWLPKDADPKADAKLSMWRAGFEDADDERIEFAGSWTDAAISKWARANLYPKMGKTFGKIYLPAGIDGNGLDASVVAIGDDMSRPGVTKILKALSPRYPAWRFTSAEVSSLADDWWSKELGAHEPKIVAFAAKKKYVLPGDRMSDEVAVTAFLQTVASGKAKPEFKSASPPANEVDDDGVTILTGDSFEKHVLDAKKDVFVEFYAPWCGACKKLAPEWQKLAEKVKTADWGSKGVIIAKMDATENECEEEIEGYPKVVFYPAVRKEKKFAKKQIYAGPREFSPMLDFLLENAENLEGEEDLLALEGTKKEASFREREQEKKKKSKKSEL